MSALSPSEYEEIRIESDTGKTIDLRLGVVSFQYFEDLFSPTITAKMVIVSTAGVVSSDKTNKLESLYNGLPIRGGEKISIKIKGNSLQNRGLRFDTPETYLYVSKISNVIRDGQKEIFVLDLVSKEAITNQLTHVNRKFPRDVSIDDNVKDILLKDLKVKPNRFVNLVEKTTNKLGFLGNLKTPFQILVWLAAKSTPAINKALTGFFFYQTQDGFNFRSIESLIREGMNVPGNTGLGLPGKVYTHKQYTNYIEESTDYNILAYTVKRNNDLLRKLIVGQYSSFVGSFNPYNGQFSNVPEGLFSLKELLKSRGKKLKNLGELAEVPSIVSTTGQDLGELPSRIMTVVKDVGTLSKKASDEENSEVMQSQKEALLRYNLLFQQVVRVIVPLNTQLRVGNTVKLRFPGAVEGNDYDRKQSGNYLIKELCHAFDTETSVTSMTVVRDTFGEFGID